MFLTIINSFLIYSIKIKNEQYVANSQEPASYNFENTLEV